MKFLVDQCCEKSVVMVLREAGHDVLSVDESMSGCADSVILALANKESRILITEDKDFGEMLFRLHMRSIGVVLLRFHSSERPFRNARLLETVVSHGTALSGNFYVISRDKTRIRPIFEVLP